MRSLAIATTVLCAACGEAGDDPTGPMTGDPTAATAAPTGTSGATTEADSDVATSEADADTTGSGPAGGESGASAGAESSGTSGSAGTFDCTLVIGYSQVAQWFTAGFEDGVSDDEWQLLARSGASVDLWANPDYTGWDGTIQSPCAAASESPDRVLLSISGSFGQNETGWANNIENAIETIRSKYPSALEIWLQPVVGGPNHDTCYSSTGEMVRASWQHAHIDNAIAMVVGGDLVAGASPEVATCDHYRDGLGHLTDEGAEAAAASLAAYYN